MKTQVASTYLVLLVGTSLYASPIQITIPDGQNGNGATVPWAGGSGLGSAKEDNETEPGTYTGDIWDLEALVYDAATAQLSLIGTFDFKNGVPSHNVTSGAIFVKGIGASSWAYAYVLDFANNSYTLYDSFTTIAPTDIAASAPANINTATANAMGSGSFGYNTGVLDPFGLGLQRESGNGHNQIDLGLNLLPVSVQSAFDVHFTLSCGNDEIQGSYQAPQRRTVPDGGATAAMLGMGLLGLAATRKTLHRCN